MEHFLFGISVSRSRAGAGAGPDRWALGGCASVCGARAKGGTTDMESQGPPLPEPVAPSRPCSVLGF